MTASNLSRNCIDHKVTPHIAGKENSVIDARTTPHPGYVISQNKRKRVEEIFGWLKTVAGLHKTHHRGATRAQWMFTFARAEYNLVRTRNLLARSCIKPPGQCVQRHRRPNRNP
jgi:hypothetical protein